jgi:hypothetical protein
MSILIYIKKNRSGKSYKQQDIYQSVTKAFVSTEENTIFPSDI